MEKRFTRRNPNGSFRIPVESIGIFRIEQTGRSIAVFGDVANKLGKYEELITLEDAKKYAAEKEKRN